MGFDLIARRYALLERMVFGGALQRARRAHLREVAGRRRIVLLGDGDGRFLQALLAAGCRAEIISVDASARMLAIARRRCGAAAAKVRFVRARIQDFEPPPGFAADAIVAQFFFDCFEEPELAAITDRLGGWLAPSGVMAVADFALPERGPVRRLLSAFLIWTMIRFFRIVARLPARRLADIDTTLKASGWQAGDGSVICGGLIRCRLWSVGHGERS